MRSSSRRRLLRFLLVVFTACGGAEVRVDDVADEEVLAGYELGGCNEGNCLCFTELAKVMDGKPYDLATINRFLGPEDPAQVFANGGSENIPLTCRTARYLVNGDPRWLERYFGLQLEAGAPHVFGGELFSSTYMALTAGNAIAVLGHARRKGHQPLAATMSRWLGAYWAALATAAVDARMTRLTAYNVHGTVSDTVDARAFNLGLVGARAYVNGHGGSASSATGDGLQGVLLSIALEHPARRMGGSLDASPGYYGGLRAAVRALGYPLDARGAVNLQARSVSPEAVGLSPQARAALTRYVQGGGRDDFSTVAGLLAGVEVTCPITVLRTTGGVLSWFAASGEVSRPCNGRKGGSWAIARYATDGHAEFVTRSSERWGGGDMGTVERVGDEVCAQSSTLPRKCLRVPAGAFVSEVVLTRTGGVTCVSGACGGGAPPPPPPPPTSSTDDARFVAWTVPATVTAGSSFRVTVTMRNTGTTTWTRDAFRLGSQAPQDNLTWGRGRVLLPASAAVEPGQSYVFDVVLTAPAAPGPTPFQWRMVHEGVQWFGAATPLGSVTVTR